MSSCCSPPGYASFFNEKGARRSLSRYRRRGLDRLSARLLSLLRDRDIRGAQILEVGGGIGALGLELLEAGAERAIVVELSAEYEDAAIELARERGLEDRIERRIGDFVWTEDLPEVDAVVMNRVVCCYPDYEALVGAASDRTRRVLVFSFPRDRAFVRAGFKLMNAWLRLRRSEFRGYAHPPAELLEVADRHGLRPFVEHRGLFWQLVGLERRSSRELLSD